jgi:hypothetical protein
MLIEAKDLTHTSRPVRGEVGAARSASQHDRRSTATTAHPGRSAYCTTTRPVMYW